MITPPLADLCDNDDETRLDSNKNKYRNLSAGWAQGGREVTSLKSTAGSWRPLWQFSACLPHVSVSLTLSVRPPNLPHQTPALVIDGTVENWKPFFSVTESTFTNNRAGAIYHTLLPASHRAFSSLLLIPALMMIIRRRNHDLNSNPTAAWG